MPSQLLLFSFWSPQRLYSTESSPSVSAPAKKWDKNGWEEERGSKAPNSSLEPEATAQPNSCISALTARNWRESISSTQLYYTSGLSYPAAGQQVILLFPFCSSSLRPQFQIRARVWGPTFTCTNSLLACVITDGSFLTPPNQCGRGTENNAKRMQLENWEQVLYGLVLQIIHTKTPNETKSLQAKNSWVQTTYSSCWKSINNFSTVLSERRQNPGFSQVSSSS